MKSHQNFVLKQIYVNNYFNTCFLMQMYNCVSSSKKETTKGFMKHKFIIRIYSVKNNLGYVLVFLKQTMANKKKTFVSLKKEKE